MTDQVKITITRAQVLGEKELPAWIDILYDGISLSFRQDALQELIDKLTEAELELR